MLRCLKGMPMLTLLSAGIMFFGSAYPASASTTFSVVVEVYNGSTFTNVITITPANVGSITGASYNNNGSTQEIDYTNHTYGPGNEFNLTITSSTSNSPSASVPASIDMGITVNANHTGVTDTLVVIASDTAFTVPTGKNLPFTTTLTGSGPGTATFTGWVDSNDNLFGVDSTTATTYGSPFVSSAGATTPGTLSAPPYSPNPMNSTTVPSLSNPFSMTTASSVTAPTTTQVYSIDNHTDVYGSPVPAGLAMAFSGLSVLGIGRFLRRNKV
jgi:hypothetical protein